METVKLLIADLSLAASHRHRLLDSLSEEQIERVNQFKNEKDQLRCMLSSYLINSLSKEEIKKGDNGKPYFESGPYFNVSHSGKYVMMVISDREIGLDIEENEPKDMSILIKIFNEAEAKMIKEHSDFYYLWCAKESLIKCMGSSISKIKEIPSLPFNGVKTFKGKDYQCQTFIYDKHIVSITRETREPFEVKLEKIDKI